MGRVEGTVQPGDEEMKQELITTFNYPKWRPQGQQSQALKGHEAPSYPVYSVAT